jgi:lactate dehydrogenase-like 2-hydroxyacid dehydrogenase
MSLLRNNKIKTLIVSTKGEFSEEYIEKLSRLSAIQWLYKDKMTEKDLTALSDKSPKVLAISPVPFGWELPESIYSKEYNVKSICLPSSSYNYVNIEKCREKGVNVSNVPHYATEAVAEWAFMMALNVARKIPMLVRNGWNYSYSKHEGIELAGKTAGIIGLGHIGGRIAEIASAMGMNVLYWSRKSRDRRYKYVELEKLMREADVIFPCMIPTKETEWLISYKMILSMKKTAIFISITKNTFNHELLLEMAAKGEIAGYAFEELTQSDFGKYPGNVWDGPQLAWVTDGSVERNIEEWYKNIEAAVKGEDRNLLC